MPSTVSKKKLAEIESLGLVKATICIELGSSAAKFLDKDPSQWSGCQTNLFNAVTRMQQAMKTEVTKILSKR